MPTAATRRTDGEHMADIELTDEERANGWTEASLKAYLAERERAQAVSILERKPPRPRWANNKYSPLRWRA